MDTSKIIDLIANISKFLESNASSYETNMSTPRALEKINDAICVYENVESTNEQLKKELVNIICISIRAIEAISELQVAQAMKDVSNEYPEPSGYDDN